MPDSSSGQDPRHPKSTYEGKYPYNRVTVTESGHEIHWDDTKGKERIRTAHKSGTYTETSPDGKQTTMVVGHAINYTKGGSTSTVDKNSDTKIGGSSRSNASGDHHEEIKGDHSQALEGGRSTIVGGDETSAVKGDSTTGIVGNKTEKVGGGSKSKVDGDSHSIVDGSMKSEVGGGISISAGGGITIKGPTITLDGEVHLGGGGGKLVHRKDDIDAAGDVAITSASRVYAV